MSTAIKERAVLHLVAPSSTRIAQRLYGQYWRLARRQPTLRQIVTCFREQPVVSPFECSEAIAYLDALRRAVYHTHDFLVLLDPETIRRVQPWSCIARLTMLDSLLSEAILTIAMFSPVCQSLLPQRVDLHLRIRAFLPRLTATYQDTLSQVAALTSQERQEAKHDL